MKSKLRSRDKRTESSNRWIYRHINDPFVRKARSENYRSRAAYKLLEINKKFNLIRKGSAVLELGSAPGSWSQVIAAVLNGTGKFVAVDLLDMEPIAGVEFIKIDAELQYSEMCQYLGGSKFDVIVSDLAPSTSGNRTTDSIASMRLAGLVTKYAGDHLKQGGGVIMKIIRGSEDEYEFVSLIKKAFRKVEYFKPDSSRKSSREIYLILSEKLT